jgi:drug/metabolite transporter (DMT)-like permease
VNHLHCEYTDRYGYLAAMSAARINLLAAIALVLCWSSGFVGAELGTREAPVDTVLAWRTLVSALVLGGWALLLGERIDRSSLLKQVVVGLLVQVIYLGGVFAAAGAGVPAGTNALIASLQPMLVVAVAGRWLGEPSSRAQRVGLLVAAVGVGLIVADDLGGGSASPLAYLFPVLAVVALASGTVLMRAWNPAGSLVTSLAIQSAVAATVFSTVAATGGRLDPPASGGFWFATAWLVVLSTFGGYGSYLLVVRRSGASRASTLLYLTPPTTALWAWALLDQQPGALALPGAVVCGIGVGLALRRTRQSVETEPAQSRVSCPEPSR